MATKKTRPAKRRSELVKPARAGRGPEKAFNELLLACLDFPPAVTYLLVLMKMGTFP